MKARTIAILDLGTNTFHLLIVQKGDNDMRVVHKEKLAVKIGKGGITKGFISAEAYERALKTIISFKETSDKFGVTEIYATATSAIRNARNGYQLVKDIKTRTNIDVNIISGEREAELIYLGVKSAMELGKSTSLVVDIGGGSVEFILCNNDTIFWKGSFEIGAQRLLDMFHKSDPISTEDTQSLVDYLDEKLIPLKEAAIQFKPVTLIGASGTFDTLVDIDTIKKGLDFSIEDEKEYTLLVDEFEKIFFDIISKNKEDRLRIPGMIEMRVDMIVVACSLIFFVISRFSIQKIRVSSYALKEGVLNKVLNGEKIIEEDQQ
jgi:exopolyphosphatase/guanosine-5'-triphosphate,3'-diphosphate pyrophosphatase